jgi:Rrf2 family protein
MRSSPLLHVTLELDHALRVLVELSEEGGRTCEQLAAATEVPPRYLSNVLQKLRRAGIIRRHVRGPVRGFDLAGDPATICVAQVVVAIQGVWAGAPVGAGRAVDEDAMGPLWRSVEQQLEAQLSSLTVADLRNLPIAG